MFETTTVINQHSLLLSCFQYGLSFIHVHSPEAATPRTFVPSLALESLPSDDEEFRPGELFAQHSQRASTGR